MSTTKRVPALDALEGRRVPGGCDDCNADALVHRDPDSGIYLVRIEHDPGCPWLAGVTR